MGTGGRAVKQGAGPVVDERPGPPDPESPGPGVTFPDHTADVALEVRADDLHRLFERAAAGLTYLLLERVPGEGGEARHLHLSSSGLPGLLREWLRELLYWHESDGFDAASSRIESIEHSAEAETDGCAVLEATVLGARGLSTPVREIKGVTLHGLTVERRQGGWFGRVVFDV